MYIKDCKGGSFFLNTVMETQQSDQELHISVVTVQGKTTNVTAM